jgi:hypothetical protein
MVTDEGQLYTIEGIAAAFMIVVTAYLVISTTSVLTQQDVHIIDLQMQQLGNDALGMMDCPDTYGVGSQSVLEEAISETNPELFNQTFLGLVNSPRNFAGSGSDRLNYSAVIYYRNPSGTIEHVPFGGGTYYRENSVKVSRWVFLPKKSSSLPLLPNLTNSVNRSVLLEVQLWRE